MSASGAPALTAEEEERLRLGAMAPPPGGIIKLDPIVIDSAPDPAPYRSAGPQADPRFGVDPTEPSPMALLGPANTAVRGPSPLPGGGLSAEQLAAAAVTPSAPAAPADATDRVLAANPIPPPLPPPGPPPGPIDIRAEAEQTIRGQGALSAQEEAAELKRSEAEKAKIKADQIAADEKARVLKEDAERQQAALDAANARTQAWLDKAEGEADKHAKMEYKDYWADKSTGSTILAGLAMMFGAVGRGDNPGMRIVNNAIERDFRLQQARIEKQGRIASDAREGHRSALTQVHELRADLAVKKANALEAVAAQAESLKRKSGVSLEEAAADKNIVGIRQEAGKTRMGGFNMLHQWNIAEENAKAARERAAAMMARAKKVKGAGGGGGGPSIKDQSAMAGLTGKIDGVVQKVIMNTGYKESVVQNRKYNQMALTLSGATNNAALAAAGAGQFVKMAQGGTGVISDSDMDIFWKRVGGKLSPDQVEQFMNDWTNGKMAPGKAKIVGDAVRELSKGAVGELNDIGNQIKTRLQGEAADIPWVAPRIPVYLDTYVPGLRASPKAAPGSAPGSAAGPPPAPVKLGNKDLALKVKAQKVVSDPKADPQEKRDAQAFLTRVGG